MMERRYLKFRDNFRKLFLAFSLFFFVTMVPSISHANGIIPTHPAEISAYLAWAWADPAPVSGSTLGSYSFDGLWMDYWGFEHSFTGTVSLTGGNRPSILATGVSVLSNLSYAGGGITYYFQLVSGYPNAPYIPIPITIESSYSVKTDGWKTKAIARLEFGPHPYSSVWTTLMVGVATGYDMEVKNTMAFPQLVYPFLDYGVYISAYGEEPLNSAYFDGAYSAFIDPVIEIDPNFYVNIDGKSVPATEVYSLVFSEGFQPTPIPEPTTMLLLGSGLIGLAGYGRRKLFKK